MTGLSFLELRDSLNAMADHADTTFRIARVIEDDSTWLATFANDSLYVIVQASHAWPDIGRSLIDVHAGGGYGLRPDGDLFRALGTATWRFDYGGPWARMTPDGSAAFGWRSRLPSDLFAEQNRTDAMGFVLGMIHMFGTASRIMADELIPQFGGSRFADDDPESWPPLLLGMLPPG
jgi:hypothetical protein